MWTVYDCVSFLANVPSLPKLVRILGWGSYFGGLNLNSKPNTFCMYLLQEISPQASAKGWRISAKLVIFASFLPSKFLKAGKVKKTNQQLIVFDQIFSPTLNVLWVYLCTNHSDSCRCIFVSVCKRRAFVEQNHWAQKDLLDPTTWLCHGHPSGQKRSINHQQSVRSFTSNHPVESVPTVPRV